MLYAKVEAAVMLYKPSPELHWPNAERFYEMIK